MNPSKEITEDQCNSIGYTSDEIFYGIINKFWPHLTNKEEIFNTKKSLLVKQRFKTKSEEDKIIERNNANFEYIKKFKQSDYIESKFSPYLFSVSNKKRIIKDTMNLGKVEVQPKLEGKQFIMIIQPS